MHGQYFSNISDLNGDAASHAGSKFTESGGGSEGGGRGVDDETGGVRRPEAMQGLAGVGDVLDETWDTAESPNFSTALQASTMAARASDVRDGKSCLLRLRAVAIAVAVAVAVAIAFVVPCAFFLKSRIATSYTSALRTTKYESHEISMVYFCPHFVCQCSS